MQKEFLLLEKMLMILDISVEGGQPTSMEKVAELQSVCSYTFLSVEQYVYFHNQSDKIFSFCNFLLFIFIMLLVNIFILIHCTNEFFFLTFVKLLFFHFQFITEAV